MKNIFKILAVFIFAITANSLFASKTTNKLPAPKAKAIQKKFMKKVDLKNSTFTWTGTKKLGDKHFGPVQLQSANVFMKNDKVQSGKFVINMKTIDSKDMKGKPYYEKLVGHLKDADFFDVEKHPTATLNIDRVDGEIAYGDLTIKGIKKPIKVPYTKNGKTFTGVLTFDRTEYGVKYNSSNFFKKLADSKIINNNVTVNFNVKVL